MKFQEIVPTLINDVFKITDKSDVLKDFFNSHDEILSSSSWGTLIWYFGKMGLDIKDLDKAYRFSIYTTYTETVLEVLEYFNIKITTLAVPDSSKLDFSYKDFSFDNFMDNQLVKYYDNIYTSLYEKEGIDRDTIYLLQRYINNNLKYKYFQFIDKSPMVLSTFRAHIKSDIFSQEQNMFQKDYYMQSIAKEYTDIVMQDSKALTLKDLYVEPHFRVHSKCINFDDVTEPPYTDNNTKYIEYDNSTIHEFLTKVLQDENLKNLKTTSISTIFISGYPGQGKSSCVKRLVYDVVTNTVALKKDIILIKLKDIQEPQTLLNENIEEVIKKEVPFEIENLDDYVIVLDGLDELYMKSGLKLSDIDNISAKLTRISPTTIITTRHNYVEFDRLCDTNTLVVELKEFDLTQQVNWLENYKSVHSEIKLSKAKLIDLHQAKKKHILELINQPILLHMIVSLDIDNIEKLDRSRLYKTFFDVLIDRKWGEGQHTLFEGIGKRNLQNSLRFMIQELAYTIFQSKYEYIHKIEFEKLSRVQQFQKLLASQHNDSLQDGLKGVMVSFYFQEVKKDQYDKKRDELNENYAIEFLHKSLIEYMTAEYIWHQIRSFLGKDSYSGEYTINNQEQALEVIWKLFNKKIMTYEVVTNLTNLIKEYENQNEKDELAQRLSQFFDYFLKKDFMYQYTVDEDSPIEKAKATFYGFWTILSNLNNQSHITTKNNEKFVRLIKLFDIDNLNISNCDFSNIRLTDMNFSGYIVNIIFNETLLESVAIYESLILDSNFFKTYMSRVFIANCGFSKSDLINSSITDSLFIDVDFSDMNMINVNFKDSKMDGGRFKKVYMNSTSFNYTRIHSDSTFEDVDFEDCTFKDAIFNDVIFKNCNLNEKDFVDAGATLVNCIFE